MDTVDRVLSKWHLVHDMYIQKVRTERPVVWTAERRMPLASCPWLFVCNIFLILFVSHCFIMSHYFSNGQQRPAAAIHPAATCQHGWQNHAHAWCLNHHLNQQSCSRFEVQPAWSAIGTGISMACVLHSHRQSRVWTRTWGRMQTGRHCNPKQ